MDTITANVTEALRPIMLPDDTARVPRIANAAKVLALLCRLAGEDDRDEMLRLQGAVRVLTGSDFSARAENSE